MTSPYKYKSGPYTRAGQSADWPEAALGFIGGKAGITEKLKHSIVGYKFCPASLRMPLADLSRIFVDPKRDMVSAVKCGCEYHPCGGTDFEVYPSAGMGDPS